MILTSMAGVIKCCLASKRRYEDLFKDMSVQMIIMDKDFEGEI